MKRRLMAVAVLMIVTAQAQGAQVEAVAGKVSVFGGEGAAELTGAEKFPYPLRLGQRIETGGDGKARISLDDGSEVTLSSGSDFTISEEHAGKESGMLQLLVGKMRVLVKKSMSGKIPSWRIRSGTALMGVRGTEFLVATNRDRTMLCTFEGKVAVETPRDETSRKLVDSNEGVVITGDGRISAPVTMDRRQMDWWRQETMLDASGSSETATRVVSSGLIWGGPTMVEALDPGARYSEYQLFSFDAGFFGRLQYTENVPNFGSGGTYQNLGATGRIAVGAAAVPTVNYALYAQGVLSGKTGDANPDFAGVRLHQAFVIVRPRSQHSLAVGRQEWEYGDGLMIGREPWNPFTRSYDGVLATIRTAPVKVRLFSAALADRNDLFDEPLFSDWMTGAYAEFSKVPLQLYGIWMKRDGNPSFVTANDIQGRYGTFGDRIELLAPSPFFLNQEFAYQVGDMGAPGGRTLSIGAYLAYLDAGVGWSIGGLSGFVKGVYLRASGDSDPNDDRQGSFVQLFPDSHRFLGLVNAFPLFRNIQRFGLSTGTRYLVRGFPVSAQLDYSHFQKVNGADRGYPRTNGAGKNLGDEIDLLIGVEPHPIGSISIGYGQLFPGNAYKADSASAYKVFLLTKLAF